MSNTDLDRIEYDVQCSPNAPYLLVSRTDLQMLIELARRASPQPVAVDELIPTYETVLLAGDHGRINDATVKQAMQDEIDAYRKLATQHPSVPVQEQSDEAVLKFAIQVEKMLCAALGREWSTAGISIESLVESFGKDREHLLGVIRDLGAALLAVRDRVEHDQGVSVAEIDRAIALAGIRSVQEQSDKVDERTQLSADIKRLVKLADDVGRSRQSNNYAMNSSAVERLVDLESSVLARIAALAQQSCPPVQAGAPVAEVDENDDGLFVDIIYGENGSPLKLGDKLYLHPPAHPAQDGEDARDAEMFQWLLKNRTWRTRYRVKNGIEQWQMLDDGEPWGQWGEPRKVINAAMAATQQGGSK